MVWFGQFFGLWGTWQMFLKWRGSIICWQSLRGPYWDMSCLNFCMMASAVFEVVLKIKGYLLKVSAMMRYSVLLCLKKPVARSCHGPFGMSLGSISCTAWFALNWVHMLHLLMYSVMSTSMPGQKTVSLVRCYIFSVPLWPLYNSLIALSYSSGGMQIW